jgi:hypothetical protein
MERDVESIADGQGKMKNYGSEIHYCGRSGKKGVILLEDSRQLETRAAELWLWI